jgi:hypothetical protein
LNQTQQAYKNLPNEKKMDFIATFEKNKGSLGWVNNYSEGSKRFASEASETVDNFMNKFQILKLNGLSIKDFESEEESDRILKLLIQESEENNNYKSEVKEHPTEPKLNRFFYVFNKGVHKKEGTEDNSEISSSSDLTKTQLKTLMDAANGKVLLDIKIENPAILKLKEKCAALQSAKKVLQEQLNKLADTHAELKAKKLSAPYNGVAELLNEVAAILEKADEFMKELRETLPVAMHHSVDADEAKSLLPVLELISEKALVHIDGMKMKWRQMKSYF